MRTNKKPISGSRSTKSASSAGKRTSSYDKKPSKSGGYKKSATSNKFSSSDESSSYSKRPSYKKSGEFTSGDKRRSAGARSEYPAKRSSGSTRSEGTRGSAPYATRGRKSESSEFPKRERSSRSSYAASDSRGPRKSYAPKGDAPYRRKSSDDSDFPKRERTARSSYGKSDSASPRRSYGTKSEGTYRRKSSDSGEFPKRERSGSGYASSESRGTRKPYASKSASTNRRKTSEDSDFPRTERSSRSSYASKPRSGAARGKSADYKRKPDSDNAFVEKPMPERGEKPIRDVKRSSGKVKKVAKPSKSTKPELDDDSTIRLNRYISNAGICSRREADKLITAGLVSVNGKIVTEMGYKVQLKDDVRYNGQRLQAEEKVYLIMNKPKDTITTTDDPEGRNTVMELLDPSLRERVYPIGRLDRNTTGVLLFTNDGEFAQRLTHPKYSIQKIYKATLNKNYKKTDMFNLVNNGVELEDGPMQPDSVAMPDPNDKMVVGVEIHSGRNRIVHRMFESQGYLVDKLDRVTFAGLSKSGLKKGQYRYLTEKELKVLKRAVRMG